MEQVLQQVDAHAALPGTLPGDALDPPTVLDLVDAMAGAHPHRVAVDDGHRQVSPFLIGIMVRRLARGILDRAPPGPVGVRLHEGVMGIVATLAAAASGRDCVVLDPAGIPEAAHGCACVVEDPARIAGAPAGCVGIDVFLSCAGTYAEPSPALPDVPADTAAIRFGRATAPAFPLAGLAAGECAVEATHPPGSGLLSCPRCLGEALERLAAGTEVRLAGAGPAARDAGRVA